MRTITKTVYSFDELSDKAKEKALEEYRDVNIHDSWADPLIEGLVEGLEEMGFKKSKIAFSGFWSQGDGASFTCDSIDTEKVMKTLELDKKYPRYFEHSEGITGSIKRDKWHNYVHENTTSLYIDDDVIPSEIKDQSNEVQEFLKDWIKNKNQEIYSDLQEDYKDLTSDEYVKDSILENDYYFEEDGSKARM